MKYSILIVVHAISIVHAENTATRVHAGPKEIPVILGIDGRPVALLEVIHQHRLLQVRAVVDLALEVRGQHHSVGADLFQKSL